MDTISHLRQLSTRQAMPGDHVRYLEALKQSGFEPKVIYDIGSCVLHWTNAAKQLWPDATYILFDAFAEAEFLYRDGGYEYHIGVLSDKDDSVVRFYQNTQLPGGNSYYREIGCCNGLYFPEDRYLEKVTSRLDTVVASRGFPLPDLVKIDVQGAEVDVIRGGVGTIRHAEHLIVELQHTQYNEGALLAQESVPIIQETLGFQCVQRLFCNNGADGDYHFQKNPVV